MRGIPQEVGKRRKGVIRRGRGEIETGIQTGTVRKAEIETETRIVTAVIEIVTGIGVGSAVREGSGVGTEMMMIIFEAEILTGNLKFLN